jgi:hypothetical protein
VLAALLGAGLVFAACGRGEPPPAASASGDANACATGKQRYLDYRDQLLRKLSASQCQTAAECGVLWENNGCVSTCGVGVPAAEREAASRDLEAFAKANCGSCPPIPTPPCAPPAPIACEQGRCSHG